MSKLADKYYGDVHAWPQIVTATNARAVTDSSFTAIENPDEIEVGQKLWLPNLANIDPLQSNKAITTVFLLRHAERDDVNSCSPDDIIHPNSGPCLTIAGKTRAKQLVQVMEKVKVQAIYSTPINRTKATVLPLATALDLPIQDYAQSDLKGLAQRVLAEHTGQIVLIVSHSGSVEALISALGGDSASCPIGGEFDNLCVVVVDSTGTANVLNLQYGELSSSY